MSSTWSEIRKTLPDERLVDYFCVLIREQSFSEGNNKGYLGRERICNYYCCKCEELIVEEVSEVDVQNARRKTGGYKHPNVARHDTGDRFTCTNCYEIEEKVQSIVKLEQQRTGRWFTVGQVPLSEDLFRFFRFPSKRPYKFDIKREYNDYREMLEYCKREGYQLPTFDKTTRKWSDQ
jgi:hypothetical protein